LYAHGYGDTCEPALFHCIASGEPTPQDVRAALDRFYRGSAANTTVPSVAELDVAAAIMSDIDYLAELDATLCGGGSAAADAAVAVGNRMQ